MLQRIENTGVIDDSRGIVGFQNGSETRLVVEIAAPVVSSASSHRPAVDRCLVGGDCDDQWDIVHLCEIEEEVQSMEAAVEYGVMFAVPRPQCRLVEEPSVGTGDHQICVDVGQAPPGDPVAQADGLTAKGQSVQQRLRELRSPLRVGSNQCLEGRPFGLGLPVDEAVCRSACQVYGRRQEQEQGERSDRCQLEAAASGSRISPRSTHSISFGFVVIIPCIRSGSRGRG